MAAVAEGNYASACSMLTLSARSRLITSVARRRTCQVAFRRCIPVNPLALKRDQSQLLFADVLTAIHGHHSSVRVSGTEVARELRRLTLVRVHGNWQITGPGRALSRCRPGRGRRTHSRRPRKQR